jgi:hypothetical protein
MFSLDSCPRNGEIGVKKKYEYIEGRKARKSFEDAMRYAFSIPKEETPAKPAPKRRKPPGRDTS